MQHLLSYKTSQTMLSLAKFGKVKIQKVPLSDSLGRILAVDIVAPQSDPQFPTASMDGYAIKHIDQDIDGIKILGDNPAGHDETREIQKGECIKTFTGSKMPLGADTLVQIENVSVSENTISIFKKVSFGSSVRPIGEGYDKGDILLKKGTKIGFAEIGVMAGLNKVMVEVAVKPRVAVIATGSEILDLGQEAQNSAQIRSSNNYTIAALFEQAGAEVIQLGTVGDDSKSIMEVFKNALESCDILVSTGGVSVGDYDFVKDIVPKLGAETLFQGVAIKPGRHVMVAQKEQKMILALPGFAYSSTVTSILYGLPLIAKMLGRKKPYTKVKARLTKEFVKRSNNFEFTACQLVNKNGVNFVNFDSKKVGSSAILINLLDGASLMIADVDSQTIEADTLVDIIVLDNI